MAKKVSNWRGKVSKDAHKSMRKSKGYLVLPEGIQKYIVEPDTKKVLFDILPYRVTDPKHPNRDDDSGIALVGDLWYKRPIKVHTKVGADNESCICLKSVGKLCPICEYQKEQFDKLQKGEESISREEIIKLYPQDRVLYIIVPKEGKHEGDIFVWDMSQKMFQDVLKDALDEDPNFEMFPDLEEGLTLEVAFKWKTINKTIYPETRNIDFIERKEGYPESFLDEVPNLDTCFKILSEKELASKFFEMDEPVSGELNDVDVEEDAPTPPRRERTKAEAKEETPVPERKRKSPAPKEVEKDDTLKWSELLNMTYRNLIRLCISYKLNLPIDEYIEDDVDSVQALREDIAKEFGIEVVKPKPKEEPTPRSRRSAPKDDPDERCPYKHRFGVDTENFDDCDTCEIWKDCIAAKSKAK